MSSLTQLFNQLKVLLEAEEHQKVYAAAMEILEKEFDLDALKLCLVALINMENYQMAFSVLKKYPNLDTELVLERGYVYYKLEKKEQLQKLLSKGFDSRGLLHLKAQFYYQQGMNGELLDVYQELVQNAPENEELDLSVNERAVLAQLLMMNDDIVPHPSTPSDDNSYDLLFNESLILLNQGNLKKALILLQKSLEICSETTSTYQEDEKFIELFPILLQTSLVHQSLGNHEESEQILTTLLQDCNRFENDDKLAKLLILNNLYALKLKDTKINSNLIYSNLKFPKILSQISLTKPQLTKFQSNEKILSLAVGKTNSKFFSLINEIDFDSDDSAVARKLFRLASKNQDLKLTLLAIQYNNQIQNYDNSYILINSLINQEVLSSYPSLISLQLFIYEHLNKDTNKLLEEFCSQVDHYDLSSPQVYKIFKEICFKLLINKQELLTLEIASKLDQVKQDQLISVILGKADTSSLSPVDALVADIDVDELISQGIEDEVSLKRSKAKLKHSRVVKPKYKRTKKVPEHLLNKTVDPERWLPMKDRSYYKPKKGKKSGATQGGSADNSTEMNITAAPTPTTTASTKSKNQKKKGKKRH